MQYPFFSSSAEIIRSAEIRDGTSCSRPTTQYSARGPRHACCCAGSGRAPADEVGAPDTPQFIDAVLPALDPNLTNGTPNREKRVQNCHREWHGRGIRALSARRGGLHQFLNCYRHTKNRLAGQSWRADALCDDAKRAVESYLLTICLGSVSTVSPPAATTTAMTIIGIRLPWVRSLR